jgi:hypothetical protein
MIFKKIVRILLVVYLVWLGLGEINPLSAQPIRSELNLFQVQEAKVAASIANSRSAIVDISSPDQLPMTLSKGSF